MIERSGDPPTQQPLPVPVERVRPPSGEGGTPVPLARRFWRLKSWDRIIVPLPFSEVTVTVGVPEYLSRELSSEEHEAERQRLEVLLDELTLRAEMAVEAVDIARPRG